MAAANTVSLDTLITIKLQTGNENRRFKLPLKDLGPNVLPSKLRTLLALPEGRDAIFERFSDSAGDYVRLESDNLSVYKQLHRAAKAKLKLRIRATTLGDAQENKSEAKESDKAVTSNKIENIHTAASSDWPSAPRPSKKSMSPKTLELAQAQMQAINAQLDAQDRMQQEHLKRFEQSSSRPSSYMPHTNASNHGSFPLRAPEFHGLPSYPKVEGQAQHEQRSSDAHRNGDYMMQLMLLEQQNKKRLLMARAEQQQAQAENAQRTASQEAPKEHEQPTVREEPCQSVPFGGPCAQFSVCCNNCNADIPGAHWHCSICMEGDYDLCAKCVESGQHCYVDHHFLIKRLIENGKVVSSTLEKVPYRQADPAPAEECVPEPVEAEEPVETEPKDVPGAYTEPREELVPEESCRTCNACVSVFEESQFVTCLECEDYDLCFECHLAMKHGHHPSHTFAPVCKEAVLVAGAEALLAPGRNVGHAAICDGCDKPIIGVRNKCFTCPDWDYCSTCMKSSHIIHPGHRFAPIYESMSGPMPPRTIHFGIRCDGPLCKTRSRQSFILGDRYKCAVCHDTDFCASCEALPTNSHNRTHPLIKFRTPVRNCSVTTYGEKDSGEAPVTMGDRLAQTSSKATETTPAAPSANAATQVQTVAELKPVEIVKEAAKIESARASPAIKHQAVFIADKVADGTIMEPETVFEQVWTLRNPGPNAWPAGCGLRFTGGDRMLNIDSTHPSSISDLDKAVCSNTIDRAVEAGENVSFSVTLRAPTRTGNAISYWRVKSPDGNAFGHRLWCDIIVEAAPQSPVKSESAEEIVSSGHDTLREPLRESQMIFPTLEKESPYSSLHDEASQAQSAPSVLSADAPEFLEDVESLDNDEDSTDDGFLTDEEYDVLDNESEFSAANNGRA